MHDLLQPGRVVDVKIADLQRAGVQCAACNVPRSACGTQSAQSALHRAPYQRFQSGGFHVLLLMLWPLEALSHGEVLGCGSLHQQILLGFDQQSTSNEGIIIVCLHRNIENSLSADVLNMQNILG